MARAAWGKPETRKSARASVRSFYGWARRSGRITVNPADILDPITVPRALPRPAPPATLEQALAAASDKDRLMLLFGAYAGLRCAEIAAVHPDDMVDGQMRVVGKGGKERRVPLHPRLVAAVDAELQRRRAGHSGTGFRYGETAAVEGGYLFPGQSGGHTTPNSVTRRLSRLLGAACSGHQLRHRFASQAYAVGRDLRAVQELLGHSKPETTARYTAIPDGALEEAVMGMV